MLLTDARRAARTGPAGRARSRSTSRIERCGIGDAIAEGVALVTATLSKGPVGAVPAAGGDRGGARRGGDAPRTPTGRRSWRCTACCSACPTTRWWRSTTRSRRRWSTGRRPGSQRLDEARRRPAPGGPPSPRRRARAPAGAGGRSRGRRSPATGARPAAPRASPERNYLLMQAARLGGCRENVETGEVGSDSGVRAPITAPPNQGDRP